MTPVGLARILGLRPPPMDAREVVFETAGEPVRVWVVELNTFEGVASDASGGVNVDLVLSTHIDEPLISDILADKLEIAVEDFAEGSWRFKWEPMGKTQKKREERNIPNSNTMISKTPNYTPIRQSLIVYNKLKIHVNPHTPRITRREH